MSGIACGMRGCIASDDWRRCTVGSFGNLRGFLNGLFGAIDDGHRSYNSKTIMELYQDINTHATVIRLTGDHLAANFFQKLVLQKQSDGSMYELLSSGATQGYNGTSETFWTWNGTTDVWTVASAPMVFKVI